jgi:lysosomal-trafficking regulator
LGDIVSVYSLETVPLTPKNVEVATDAFDVTETSIGDDFVKVSMNLEGKSQLRLHTINARYINHLTLQTKIEAICCSGIKEGSGVNVIAVGFENGHINLYSSWNLNFVREIDIGKSDIQR